MLGPGVQAAIGVPALAVIGGVIGAVKGPERWQAVETRRGPKMALEPAFDRGPSLRLAVSF